MRRINGKIRPSEVEVKRRKIQLENEKYLHKKSDENFIHSTFKAFTRNTSIHGVHYLTEESIRMIEKFLWLLIILLASLAMVYCCLLLSARFRLSLTSTVFESTSYQVAEIPFASIALCNNNRINYNKTDDAVKKFFPNRSENETQIFVKFLQILQNMDFGSFDEFQEIVDMGYNKSMDHLNLTEIYEFMMHDCEDFLLECRWRKRPFECCKLFSKQKTEYGICWSFNSLSSELNAGTNLSYSFPRRVHAAGRKSALEVLMKLNRNTSVTRANSQHGILAIIQHPQEYPSNGQFVVASKSTSLIIKPTAFTTSDDVSSLEPADRQCYYDHEVESLKVSHLSGLPYTRASCMSSCRQEHLIKYCNCSVGFLFPIEAGYSDCNVTGILCLIKYNEIFNAEKVPESPFFDPNEEGIECTCLPECSRIEYAITMSPIYDEQEIDEEYVKIDTHYASAFMMKYRTDRPFGWMDLVVGFGGIMGLFFGCSLLSGAEICYFSTIGLFYQYKRNRGKIMKKIRAKFPFVN